MTADRVSVWVQDLVDGVPDWTAGTWNVQRRLIPEGSLDADGSMGTASFRLLRRIRNDGTGDTADTFVPTRGQYVVIADLGGETPFDTTVHWAGQIVGVNTQPLRGISDEVGAVDAIGLGSVLEQTPVANLKQRDPAGGAALTLLTNPTANLAGANGQVIGNCYTGSEPKLFESLPDNIGAGTNVDYWSRWDLLVHVTTYAPEDTKVPTLSLGAGSAMGTYLQEPVAEVFELDTLNLKSFLDLMVGPASGGTWSVSPSAAGWSIVIDSASDVGVGDFPASSSLVNVTVNGNDVNVQLAEGGQDVPDGVEVIGAPIVYCGTVSELDGSMGSGWSSAQEAAFLAGGASSPGYSGFTTDKKIQFNRNVRRSAPLHDAFARFELRRNTPTADVQCSSVTTLAAPPAAGSTQPLCPAITWDGSSTSVNGSNAASPYLPTARILNFLPIPLNDTTASDSALAQPTYMQPLVYRYVASGDAYDAWPLWADMLHPPSTRWSTPNVQTDDRGPAIRIEYDHPETLARADWTGTPAATEFDPTLTTSYGATDWRNLILTIAVEGDQRVRAAVYRSGVITPRNVLRIYRKDLHCWLVRAGTITELGDTGAVHYASDTFTRDDHPIAQRLAEQAAAFAIRTRTGAVITLTDPANPPAWASVGTIIGTLSETDANGTVLATRTLNTVVRSVRRVWDPKQPRLVVTLDYPTLPIGGMGASQTSVSLGGSVHGSLQRTQADVGSLARGSQRSLIAAARPGRTDALAKTFTVSKTAHGWIVGNWIGWDDGSSAWVTASRTGTYENLAFVTEVVDADNVTVAHGSGLVYAPTLTYDDYSPYFLATAGGVTGPLSPDDATKTAPVVERLVFWSIESHWIWLAGSYLRDGHNHHLADGADVLINPGTLADGDLVQYDLASTLWKNVTPASVLSTALGSAAAISVYGRSANSAGVRADIAASTTGDVLQMGATALIWGQLQTASYAAASVTAAKLASDVVLNALQDTSVTGYAANEFLRVNGAGTAWINYDLGPIAYASSTSILALDGGATGAPTNVLLSDSSRLILSGSGSPNAAIEWKLSGDVDLGTEVVARIRAPGSSQVSFYDNGDSTITSGTEVLRWNCSSSAASRSFAFLVPLQVQDTGTKNLVFTGTTTQTWTLGDDIGPSTWLTFLGASADAYGRRVRLAADIDVQGFTFYGDRTNGTSSSRLLIGATDGTFVQTGNLTLSAGNTLTLAGSGSNGVLVGATTSEKVGFWGHAGVAKTSVSAPSAVATFETAGAAYGATEQSMLGHLKTDVTNLRLTLFNMQAALAACGLV